MTFPTRAFGVEIECFVPSWDEVEAKFSEAGIEVSRYHTRRSPESQGWKLTDDGSLYGSPPGHRSVEIVSPILSGETGLQTLQKVCEILRNLGAKVNRSCGFHVHVDARDLTVDTCKEVNRRYGLHETTIDSFMPPSRRNCRHAATVQGVSYSESRKESFRGVNRYLKVNLQALAKHGTIEFRQHSGTTNFDKMSNWIQFLLEFVEATRASTTPTRSEGAAPRRRRNMTRQLLTLAELVLQGNPSITAVCEALAIQPSSLPGYVARLSRACGVRHDTVVYIGSVGVSLRVYCRPQVEEFVRTATAELAAAPPEGSPTSYVWGPRLVGKLRSLASALISDTFNWKTTEWLSQQTGIATGSVSGYVQRLRQLTGANIRGRRDNYSVRWNREFLVAFATGTEDAADLERRLQACATTVHATPRRAEVTAAAPPPASSQPTDWTRGISPGVVSWLLERAQDFASVS